MRAPNRIESVKCMQRCSGRQVPGLPPADRARPLASLRRPWRGRGSQGRRSGRLVSHFGDPRRGCVSLKACPRLPDPAPHPGPHRSGEPATLHPFLPKGEGVGQARGSRNALSARETEQTGSLMESNQSRGLESPIAMAAEFPESDKAQRPSLPPRPCPPLPFPGAAGSRAGSALRRGNHCKNKEMKGSPIGGLSAAFSWA